MIFDKVTETFQYYRYECGMATRLYDESDFFIKAAKDIHIQYEDDNAYEDARAWKRCLNAGQLTISGKIKFKQEYVAAQVAKTNVNCEQQCVETILRKNESQV